MSNFQQILNEEVRRLARKEIKSHVVPVLKTISDLKQQIRDLRNQIKVMNEQLLKQQTVAADTVAPVETTPAEKQIRLTAGRIRACREKQGLSRKEFADLIGTTFVSVSNWENGKTVPRLSQKKKIVVIRDMGKRELVKLLAEKKKAAVAAAELPASQEETPVEPAAGAVPETAGSAAPEAEQK
ncbi:MAG: helix-turn-helix transcriptional regulator [Lentisphaeria bacterium]|nr:helix-turn-helix transcriptional regulator [Lentisphaeria bacterium]